MCTLSVAKLSGPVMAPPGLRAMVKTGETWAGGAAGAAPRPCAAAAGAAPCAVDILLVDTILGKRRARVLHGCYSLIVCAEEACGLYWPLG